MKIEGGQAGWVYHVTAAQGRHNHHNYAFDVADSDDAAYGRAMKLAHKLFPTANGWTSHYARTLKISEITRIGPLDIDDIKPVEL